MAGFAILGTTEPDFYRGSATGIPRNKTQWSVHFGVVDVELNVNAEES